MWTVIITITTTDVLMYPVKRSNTQKAYGYVVRKTNQLFQNVSDNKF